MPDARCLILDEVHYPASSIRHRASAPALNSWLLRALGLSLLLHFAVGWWVAAHWRGGVAVGDRILVHLRADRGRTGMVRRSTSSPPYRPLRGQAGRSIASAAPVRHLQAGVAPLVRQNREMLSLHSVGGGAGQGTSQAGESTGAAAGFPSANAGAGEGSAPEETIHNDIMGDSSPGRFAAAATEEPTPTSQPIATPTPDPTPTPVPTSTPRPEPTATPTPRPEPIPTPRPHGATARAEVLHRVLPSIPDELAEQVAATSVVVRFRIEADGSSEPSLLKSTGNARIDEAILRAARQWHWKPATSDGEPIASTVRQPIRFVAR